MNTAIFVTVGVDKEHFAAGALRINCRRGGARLRYESSTLFAPLRVQVEES